jgi:hypothetical protein
MTQQTRQTLNFPEIGRGRGWKDAFVVTFLVVMLGAFVAQIGSSPRQGPSGVPVAEAGIPATGRG